MIRQAKKAFIKKLCEDIKVNPKHFWNFKVEPLKKKGLRVRKQNGETTKTDVETANEMNKAFQSVFIQEDVNNIPEFDIGYHGPITGDIDVQ